MSTLLCLYMHIWSAGSVETRKTKHAGNQRNFENKGGAMVYLLLRRVETCTKFQFSKKYAQVIVSTKAVRQYFLIRKYSVSGGISHNALCEYFCSLAVVLCENIFPLLLLVLEKQFLFAKLIYATNGII